MTDNDEWKEARATIGRFDSTLADLRKFGFGLVTALITLDAFLSQNASVSLGGESKVAVTAVTVVLITALFGLDRYYVGLTVGAVQRARDLEQGLLRLDARALTGAISRNAGRSWNAYIIVFLYIALLATTIGLGLSSLTTETAVDMSSLASFGNHVGQVDGPTKLGAWGGFAALILVVIYSITRLREGPKLNGDLTLDGEAGWQTLLVWLTGIVGLIALLSGFAELVSQDHHLRAVILAGLFGAEAILGYFAFTEARSRFRPLRWSDGWTVMAIEAVGPPGASAVRIRGTGLDRLRYQLLPPEGGQNALGHLDLWIDTWRVERAEFRLDNGAITCGLPARDGRSGAAVNWQPGSALVQVRTEVGLIVAGARLTFAQPLCDALNLQQPPDEGG